ncbi:MAG: NADH-quinone oxidoreductase subunit J [Paenibacillus sp.]|nr:NADH-quinone oxidoreductase subunit J [Paenibacillus sp.]
MPDLDLDLILNGQTIAYFMLAICAIVGAILMISFTKVVHMVVSLALVFLSLAGIYLLLEAEFVAFVQVLVYAGAISILMIFGIMMTRHDRQEEHMVKRARSFAALIGCGALFAVLFLAIRGTAFIAPEAQPLAENNTLRIGELLFTEHVIPFELLSVLLTVAFIGAIVLAKSDHEEGSSSLPKEETPVAKSAPLVPDRKGEEEFQ